MNILAHLHFSKKSSTTCCYLPPLLSETRDHLWYNGIASRTLAQSVLYRCNSQRRLGGFEAVQLLKSQIYIWNIFKISDFKSFWNVQHSKSFWNVFLHFCLKPEIPFDSKSSLHEHLHRVFCIVVTLREDWGGFEAVQLWSHKSTFEIYFKSQILNLFEMSNMPGTLENIIHQVKQGRRWVFAWWNIGVYWPWHHIF